MRLRILAAALSSVASVEATRRRVANMSNAPRCESGMPQPSSATIWVRGRTASIAVRSGCQRVLPLEIRKAGEVAVGGLQRQAMLDGHRRQVRIGDEPARHPGRLEKSADDLPMPV